jgi:hypothetical protein
MARFLNLTQLELHPALERTMDDMEAAGADKAEKVFLADVNPLAMRPVHGEVPGSRGDALLARYHYLRTLERRGVEDLVRRCFVLISLYDMMLVVRPRATGHRLSEPMAEHLIELVGSTDSAMRLPADVVVTQLRSWCNWGKKLAHVFEELGPGAIWYLGPLMTDDA